jgi:excisionase family DNA binding protein
MGDNDSNAEGAELLTVAQAAHLAGVSRHTISGWITQGRLPAVRVMGRRHIRPTDLAATQALVHAGTVVPAWRDDPRHAAKRLRAAGGGGAESAPPGGGQWPHA